ncbi:MAG: GGDEF domain-containing protein [Ruminococcaceae bacterium]|nr:GGDEF domain-containing protein [Oscillospiraceae bacterium]
MKKRLSNIYTVLFGSQLPIKERFFNFAALGGIGASTLATIASAISKVGKLGLSVCFVCIALFAITFIAFRITKKLTICIIACLVGLNGLIFPALYLTCGGITGGMPIYFVMGLVFTVLMLDSKEMIIMLGLESIWYIIVFYYSYVNRDYLSEYFFQMPVESMYLDQAMDFFIVGFSTSILVKALAIAFEYQQNCTNKLLKQLEELSIKDPLSCTYNRRFLLKYIESGIEKNKKTNTPLSIIMFDIDNFKKVNDDYGHLIGDEVIKGIAEILIKNCRNYDVVARYGGEEFLLVMPGASVRTAFDRAEKIRKKVEKARFVKEIEHPITVSCGIAEYLPTFKTVEEFIGVADKFLYIAKKSGRNKTIWKGSQKQQIEE